MGVARHELAEGSVLKLLQHEVIKRSAKSNHSEMEKIVGQVENGLLPV